jgi:serine protease Do
MKKLLLLFISLQFTSQVFSQNIGFDIHKLENDVQHVIQQAYHASVYITPYDSIIKKAVGGSFSGVVIDTAGHILSAAHAVRPDKMYEVTFPDGRKFRAIGLGRIPSNDAAMMKINEKGSWPYAAMGWSSSLKKDMPCISIAYPGTVGAKTPTVRLGYIAEPETAEGFIRTTCLMEPGDSGGPVFDMKGRVIGLHSKIDLSLDDNFEIPVDLYRKYWTALNNPLSYTKLPEAESIAADLYAAELKAVPEIENISTKLKKAEIKLNKTSLRVKSSIKGAEKLILGTLVKLNGIGPEESLRGKSFLISKSSMVGNDPIVELNPGKSIRAKVISRDEDNDLVLLQIEQKLKAGVTLESILVDSVSFAGIGKLLISPQPQQDGIVSVLGNTQISIARGPNPAFIGVGTSLKDGKVVVSMVQPRSPASEAAIETGDELNSFNGKPIFKAEDLSKEMAKYMPNDTVNIQFARAGVAYSKQIVLKPRRSSERHIAYRFTDGRSERREGFNHVLIHDGKLKPAACGGPLYGIDGQFYGINIARLSRTSSLAIPAAIVSKFVRGAFLNGNLQTMLSTI